MKKVTLTVLFLVTFSYLYSESNFKDMANVHKKIREATGLSKTKLYAVWNTMKQRCNNPNNKVYKYYGGRGIKICDRWLESFINFKNDIGDRPSNNHSIDRIDNNIGYSPSNCKWATREEQSTNRRSNIIVEYMGVSGPLKKTCEKFNLPYRLIKERMRHGLSFEESIKRRKANRLVLTYKGETDSLVNLSKKYNIRYQLVHFRIFRDGYTVEQAFESPIKRQKTIV